MGNSQNLNVKIDDQELLKRDFEIQVSDAESDSDIDE